jgi:hypothetical protein
MAGEMVTVDANSWRRAMNAEAEKRKEAAAERRAQERGGITSIKQGRYKEGGLAIVGAQLPWLQPILLGGGLYALATMKAVTDIGVFKDHWWLRPLVILGIGIYLQRQGHVWAESVIASGSALLYQLYEEHKAKEEKKPASGPEDVGYPWAQEGRWERTPNGGWALQPPHGAGRRIAHRLFEEERAAV